MHTETAEKIFVEEL